MALGRLTKRQFNEVTNEWLKYQCNFGHDGKHYYRTGKHWTSPYPKYNRCWLRHWRLKAWKQEVDWIRQLKVGDKAYYAHPVYKTLTVSKIRVEWYRGMDVEYIVEFNDFDYSVYHEPFDKNGMMIYKPDGEYALYLAEVHEFAKQDYAEKGKDSVFALCFSNKD